jgi:hypothetical protein
MPKRLGHPTRANETSPYNPKSTRMPGSPSLRWLDSVQKISESHMGGKDPHRFIESDIGKYAISVTENIE